MEYTSELRKLTLSLDRIFKRAEAFLNSYRDTQLTNSESDSREDQGVDDFGDESTYGFRTTSISSRAMSDFFSESSDETHIQWIDMRTPTCSTQKNENRAIFPYTPIQQIGNSLNHYKDATSSNSLCGSAQVAAWGTSRVSGLKLGAERHSFTNSALHLTRVPKMVRSITPALNGELFQKRKNMAEASRGVLMDAKTNRRLRADPVERFRQYKAAWGNDRFLTQRRSRGLSI